MTGTSDVQRVFIVGSPRSGTTLFQTWLMSTAAVTSFSETHLFQRVSTHRDSRRQAVLNVRASALMRRWAATEGVSRRPRVHADHRRLIDDVIACLDEEARRAGHSIWVEKTPHHLHHLALIEATVDDPKFIFIRREAVATINSLVDARQYWLRAAHRDSRQQTTAQWFHDRVLTELEAERTGGLVLDYEALLDDPAECAARAGRFLGIDASQFGSIDQLQHQAARVIRPEEANWKSNNLASQVPDRSRDADGIAELVDLARASLDVADPIDPARRPRHRR